MTSTIKANQRIYQCEKTVSNGYVTIPYSESGATRNSAVMATLRYGETSLLNCFLITQEGLANSTIIYTRNADGSKVADGTTISINLLIAN